MNSLLAPQSNGFAAALSLIFLLIRVPHPLASHRECGVSAMQTRWLTDVFIAVLLCSAANWKCQELLICNNEVKLLSPLYLHKLGGLMSTGFLENVQAGFLTFKYS